MMSSELIIPRFPNTVDSAQCIKNTHPFPQMFNPFLHPQHRLNPDNYHQGMHINMLLHQLLLGAAARQTSPKQPDHLASLVSF